MDDKVDAPIELNSQIYADLIYRRDKSDSFTRTVAFGIVVGVEKAKRGNPDFKEGETVYKVRLPHIDGESFDLREECEIIIDLARDSLSHSYGQVSDVVGFTKPPNPLIRHGREYIRQLECQSAGPFRMKNPQSTGTLRALEPT